MSSSKCDQQPPAARRLPDGNEDVPEKVLSLPKTIIPETALPLFPVFPVA